MSIRRRPQLVRGRRRTLAVAVAVSATVVTPLAVSGSKALDEPGPAIAQTAADPQSTGESQVSLAGAPTAQGVNRNIAGGGAEVKEISSPTPFSMIGVTWKGRHDAAEATVRAKQADGSWGPWYSADAADGGPKRTKADARGGTDPIFLGAPTTAVQISVSGVEIEATSLGGGTPASATPEPKAETPAAPSPSAQGPAPAAPADADIAGRTPGVAPLPIAYDDVRPVADTSALPSTRATDADVKAVLLSPSGAPASAPTEQYGDTSAEVKTGQNKNIAVSKPAIISRSGWGADESIRCSDPYYDDGLAAAVVHHTAGSNDYSKDQSAGIVRGIYTYHAVNLGWCDVGYHVLVDKYGQAFEGAYGGLDKPVQGAHTGGFNANTMGISMMGDYSSVKPSDATIQKVGEVLGWRLAVAGIDPKGKSTHYSEGTPYTFVGAGQAVELPNIFAHRDVGTTTCPGDSGYAQMGRIRDIAKQYSQGGGSTPSQPSNPTPSTGGSAGTPSTAPKPNAASVVAILGDIVKKVLSGGKLDASAFNQLLQAGLKLANIPSTPGELLTLATNGGIQKLFTQLGGSAGPLGKALSGVQKFGNVSLAKFENGAIYSAPETGAHAVHGKLGDAWAAQGYERGPLGLPVTEEQKRSDGSIAQRFQNGTLVFTPSTGLVTVQK